MRRLLLLPLLIACTDGAEPIGADPLDEVDPFIGTGGLGFGVGSIAPGPRLPFGLANPSPDTSKNGGAPGFNHCAGYYWEDDQIRGFSQIHLSGTGVPDYGALLIMPMTEVVLAAELTERRYRDRLDHRRERASVGSYQVHLVDADVGVEITATKRSSLYRISYPAGPARLAINLDHGLGNGTTVAGDITHTGDEIVGSVLHEGDLSERFGGFELFYAMRFSTPPVAVDIDGRKAVVDFGPDQASPVLIEIGLSFVDAAGARSALTSLDFDATKEAARAAWRSILSRVRVEGGTAEDRTKFYTALYHAYQMPTLLSDADGRYRGVDGEIHTAEGFEYYSDFSLWDTFRTTHPLFTLLTPGYQTDFNRSLVRMLEEGGHIPRWPLAHGYTWTMLGNHGESMLIDAYLKGVGGGIPIDEVYDHMLAAARGRVDKNGLNRSARECIDHYLTLGFCPADQSSGATSETLENAYNDWMLANLSDALERTEEAQEFRARERSWRQHFNPETGFLQAKNADGSFLSDFDDELFSSDFVEGNARQWTVYVPHDTSGLAELMDSDEALVAYLERFFGEAAKVESSILPDLWYWHGNEPDIHAAYMFTEVGRPDLTKRWVAWIMDERYGTGPDGLAGNDDGGTLSAWYVFSALGFYPLAGSDRYYVGAPRFDRVEIDHGDETLVIKASGKGDELEGPYVTHARLVGGDEIVIPR